MIVFDFRFNIEQHTYINFGVYSLESRVSMSFYRKRIEIFIENVKFFVCNISKLRKEK